MNQKQQILHYYRVDENGPREISRKVGVNRKTVRKLIQAYEDRLTQDLDLGMEEFLAELDYITLKDLWCLTHP